MPQVRRITLDGIEVTLMHNGDGQPTVVIDTENYPVAERGHGYPVLQVLLNDGALYDVERAPSEVFHIGHCI